MIFYFESLTSLLAFVPEGPGPDLGNISSSNSANLTKLFSSLIISFHRHTLLQSAHQPPQEVLYLVSI